MSSEYRRPADVVHVVGERLPLAPLHALVQRGAGDVLDALHQLDQRLLAARAHRREADAAVAHHDRGRTVAGRRIHHVVPADLAVVVGVHVDPAGRDDRAVGVDGLVRGVGDRAADRDDHAVAHADVAGRRRRTRPVDDRSTLDHVIEHVGPLCRSIPRWRPYRSAVPPPSPSVMLRATPVCVQFRVTRPTRNAHKRGWGVGVRISWRACRRRRRGRGRW